MNCELCGRRLTQIRTEVGELVTFDTRDFYVSPRGARARPRVYRVRNGVAQLSEAHASVGRDGPFKRPHSDVCDVKHRNPPRQRYVR